jgi:hypothetical protein
VTRLYLIAGAIALGMAAWGGATWYAYQRGYEAARLDAMKRSVEILRERAVTDENIRGMSDRQLCVALGGLPDECAGI